jgi:hypothetical protein
LATRLGVISILRCEGVHLRIGWSLALGFGDLTAVVAELERAGALAERAGVPVRDVLVADASRRTRRENAYVSGLGATRRVVLVDNLLADSEPSLRRSRAARSSAGSRLRSSSTPRPTTRTQSST